MFETTIDRLRVVGLAEGISFLLLLFIAMPLKYMYGMPIATKIMGMLHGGLFLWFLKSLYDFHVEHRIGMRFNAMAFVSSIVPFGTFYLDKKLKQL